MRSSNNARSKSTAIKSAISVSTAGLISSGHHVYGALAYETPWRLVVSLWIPAFVLLILLMLYLSWSFPYKPVGRIAAWFVFLGGVVFQTGFTLFECVYSHVVKNVLYFAGISREILGWLFPAPAYHLPDNLWFEMTGVAQLAGLWAAWWAWRVFMEHKQASWHTGK